MRMRRGNLMPPSLFHEFEVCRTEQTVNEKGRVTGETKEIPYTSAKLCVAESDRKDIEVFKQRQLDITHTLVGRGWPKAKRLDILRMCSNPQVKYEVVSVDNPGLWSEWTLYYCKEL